MSSIRTFLSIGECMLELSQADGQLWRMGYAGDTLNTAWYVRAILSEKAWRVAYFTRLGVDGFSQKMIGFLDENGITTGYIQRDDNRRPGLYAIELSEGERSFTYWRDQSAARHLADDETALGAAVGEADAVYISGITLAILKPDRRKYLIGEIARATRAGKLTAFDPNIRPRLWENEAALRGTVTEAAAAVKLVLPSFDDEHANFGDADPEATARRYRDAGAEEVVVKNGPSSAVIATGDNLEIAPATKVTTLVDTTGAGDSFNGAYLAARITGASPMASVAAGHRLAGLVVQRRGALVAMDEVNANLTEA